MKRRNQALLLASTTLLAARLGIGCASDADAGNVTTTDETDAAVDTGTAVVPSPDADASDDATVDATTDAGAPTCSADGWCHTVLPARDSFDAAPPPEWGPKTLFQINSVWVSPDHTTWAVTGGGHVLRWDGTAWSLAATVGKALYSVWGSSATDLWIGGDQSLVLHATVSGTGPLTLTPVNPGTLNQPAKVIQGTSATDIWVVGAYGGVYHLETPSDGGAPAFVTMDLPSDFPGPDYIGPFAAATLWTKGSDVWVAGNDDRYWCDMNGCTEVSEFVVRKWKGGNDGDASWDRVRMLRTPQTAVEQYARVRLGVTTSDGMQVVIINGGTKTYAVRIAASDSQLSAGDIGIQHDSGYAWSLETIANYVQPEGIWATNSKDVWLAGPTGLRHFDGATWQIGRITLAPPTPVLNSLHAIQGIAGTSAPDLWSVGDDIAMHRTVTP